MKQFDYIIAGAGAAGLTLAYALMVRKDTKKTVLLLDRDKKDQNDRTWCFWEKEENLFEELVYKSWTRAKFSGPGFKKSFDISPYRYKMIRGVDFYDFMKDQLSRDSRVTWLTEEVKGISPEGIVKTVSGTYQASLVFDSRFEYQSLIKEKSNTLLQHFKGYVIETQDHCFDMEELTYMDFNVDQEGDCRFGYVLPFNTNKALVEYTIFNKQLLDKNSYKTRLEKYIKSIGIKHYEILEEEYGIIPMTDFPFRMRESEKIINIGINGGFAKASTGYTFLRGQKILKKMAENLIYGKDPLKNLPYQKGRFRKYDATLLSVLGSNKYTGDQLFTPMFKKNGATAFFKFLDEETSLNEDLKIMSSTPLLDFGAAFIKSLLK